MDYLTFQYKKREEAKEKARAQKAFQDAVNAIYPTVDAAGNISYSRADDAFWLQDENPTRAVKPKGGGILYQAGITVNNEAPAPFQEEEMTPQKPNPIGSINGYIRNSRDRNIVVPELSTSIHLYEVQDKPIEHNKIQYYPLIMDIVTGNGAGAAANKFVFVSGPSRPAVKYIKAQLTYLLSNPAVEDPTRAQVTKRYLFDFSDLTKADLKEYLKIAKYGNGDIIDFTWIEVFQALMFERELLRAKAAKKTTSSPFTQKPFKSGRSSAGLDAILDAERRRQEKLNGEDTTRAPKIYDTMEDLYVAYPHMREDTGFQVDLDGYVTYRGVRAQDGRRPIVVLTRPTL